ncbi:MAG: hypothetical protein LBH00_10515 [Planctomycetaceae bacterium]|jgi:hypothetical protein|nr:hypothetical protein [Planctomycetaceae bacterium]
MRPFFPFFFSLVFGSVFILLSGCKPPQKHDTAAALAQAAGVELGDVRHQKEDFDRSFEIINALDDSPSLPNSPGFERIVSTADRLDKWIRNQKPEEHWEKDEFYSGVETAARNAAGSAKQIVRTLNLLQGKEEDRKNGENPPAGEKGKIQEVTAALNRFIADLQTLSGKGDLPGIGQYSDTVAGLQRKFAALESMSHLDAAAVRSFANSLQKETKDFAEAAKMLEAYAVQLKTDGLFISVSDVEYLKQSAWLRDLSKWAGGGKRVLLEQAVQLCDWTVCNIEMQNNVVLLDSQQTMAMPQQYPWQTVLLGYGTVLDRMTVLLELLRQQRIDAAMLAVPHPKDPKVPLFWAVGVLIDGEVYIFLPDYGFPLPAKEGVKIADDGSLQFTKIATFSQLIEDESLLRQLDIAGAKGSAVKKFPVTADMLKQTSAYLFVTPESMSLRMKTLEAELSGEQNAVLYTDPQELRRRFAGIKGITAVEFWKYPLRTAFEQRFAAQATHAALALFLIPSLKRYDYPLWSGRVLYLKGNVSGQDSAVTQYQNARVPDRELIRYRNDPRFRNDPDFANVVQTLPRLTVQASFWLGAASFEQDSLPAAKDYFNGIRTNPQNAWRSNTEYLLGRIAEREKRYADAVKHYENTSSSLSGAGNAVRGQWLPKGESK